MNTLLLEAEISAESSKHQARSVIAWMNSGWASGVEQEWVAISPLLFLRRVTSGKCLLCSKPCCLTCECVDRS